MISAFLLSCRSMCFGSVRCFPSPLEYLQSYCFINWLTHNRCFFFFFNPPAEQPPKSDPVLEFITPPLVDDRDTSPSPSLSQTEIWKLKEQELSNERPFRLRLNSQPEGVQLTPLAKRLMDLKTCDHDVSDVANVLPKPPPSASIPSKCR